MVLAGLLVLVTFAGAAAEPAAHRPFASLRILDRAVRAVLPPRGVACVAGLRLVYDAVPPAGFALAVARSALRANPTLDSLDALSFASAAELRAREVGLYPPYFAGLLLQESAFDARALSAAGAVGIAQFMLGTASAHGVDPFDPYDAIRGAAVLVAGYVRAYDGRYPEPYAAAFAAYNAGPAAVSAFGGVPPYAETREYVDDIYDRAARIVRDGGRP